MNENKEERNNLSNQFNKQEGILISYSLEQTLQRSFIKKKITLESDLNPLGEFNGGTGTTD